MDIQNSVTQEKNHRSKTRFSQTGHIHEEDKIEKKEKRKSNE